MDYMVQAPDGTVSGPFSEQELIRHVAMGTVTADYSVRPTVFPKWEKAERIVFLKPMLHPGEPADGPEQAVRTSFENRLEPCPAPLLLRMMAGVWDLAVILLIFLLVAGTGTLIVRAGASADRTHESISAVCKARDKKAEKEKKKREKHPDRTPLKKGSAPAPVDAVEKEYPPTVVADEEAGFHPASLWTDTKTGERYVCISAESRKAAWYPVRKLRLLALVAAACFFTASLLSLLIPAGFTAQTRGMRFFGIFISDADDPREKDVLEIRASLCCLLSLLTGILALPFLLLGKPTPAERLTRTRIIRVAAKSK